VDGGGLRGFRAVDVLLAEAGFGDVVPRSLERTHRKCVERDFLPPPPSLGCGINESELVLPPGIWVLGTR